MVYLGLGMGMGMDVGFLTFITLCAPRMVVNPAFGLLNKRGLKKHDAYT